MFFGFSFFQGNDGNSSGKIYAECSKKKEFTLSIDVGELCQIRPQVPFG